MRTENDLRTALRSLEPTAPDGNGVLRTVRRRAARRRILRVGGLAGFGGLAAGAAAVAIVTATSHDAAVGGYASGSASPSATATRQAETAAYIVERAAAAENAAAQMIQVTRDNAGADYLSVATQQTIFISSRRTASGHPLMASGEGIKGTTYSNILVDYKDRVYAINSASTLSGGPWGAKGIVIGSWLPGVTASDPASAYFAALKRGVIKVIGYRNLDGRQTILIQINYQKAKEKFPIFGPHKCKAHEATPCAPMGLPSPPAGCNNMPAPAMNEVWLDASTYLEVQEATIEPRTAMHLLHKPGITWACYTQVGWSTPSTTRVDWLPPTKQNLALLNLTPPAGFIQVSNQQIAQYLGPYS